MTAADLRPRFAPVAAMLLAAVVAAAAQPPAVTDLDGRPIQPLVADGPATVLVFTAVECPISNRYAPEVRRLAARFADKGVATWIVYANAGESPAAARAHAAAFAYGLPVVLDPGGVLADRAGAMVTPEAAVFDRSGRRVYRGRIDDRYVDFGVDRPVPTTHDLAAAVAAALEGRPLSPDVVPAVGCAIVRHRP